MDRNFVKCMHAYFQKNTNRYESKNLFADTLMNYIKYKSKKHDKINSFLV